MVPLLLTLAAVAALVTIFLIAIGETSLAVGPGILMLILVLGAGFDEVTARRKLERHGESTPEFDADSRDSFPAMTDDEDVPLGATREAHDELDPHDLPLDHPSRETVDERNGRPGPRETTRRP